MNERQKNRLGLVIQKRRQAIDSVMNFEQLFSQFAHYTLKQTVAGINEQLEGNTSENLRIFYENPYENKRSRFFVMVQLLSLQRRNSFLLDNTLSFPLISFDGNEFTGRVKTTIKFEEKLTKIAEHDIQKLVSEEVVAEIIIDFLDKIYSL